MKNVFEIIQNNHEIETTIEIEKDKENEKTTNSHILN